ncbi:MAG: RHS repeat-associated core domain-containing protein, partial [Acidimicrobiales bacterium]
SVNGTTNLPYSCSPDPVNCATGNLTESVTDLTIQGRGVGLDSSRSYNSLGDSSTGMFGYGWSSSYGAHLSVDPGTADVTVTQGNGSTVVFEPALGGFTSGGFNFATLKQNSDGSYTYVVRQRETSRFSSAGQLLSESDLNGYVTSLAYDSVGRLSTVTDSAGRSLTFAYDGTSPLVSSVTDGAGRVVRYGYDGSGDLTSVTDPLGRQSTYTYDANHDLLTATSPKGGVVTNTYDSQGRVTKQVDAAGLTTTFAYGSGTTTITGPYGSVESETFDTNLELVSRVAGSNSSQPSTWSYSYDPNTLSLASVTDSDSHTMSYTYDAQGDQLTSSDGLQKTKTFQYDGLGDLVKQTDPMGIVSSYVYDAAGNVQSKTLTAVGGSPSLTTTYSYGDAYPGDITKVVDPAGHETDYTYDGYGDVTAVSTHPSSQTADTTTYEYDALGRKVCETSPDATASGVVCAPAGQPPASNTTTWTYDADSEVLSSTDALGHTTSGAYELAPGSDPRCPNVVPGAAYCDSATDAASNTSTTWFDADDRKLAVTSGEGSPAVSTTQFAYNLIPVTPVTESDPCASSVTVNGDAVSYCTTSTDPLGNVTLDYLDAQGRQIEEAQPTTGTTTDTYDAAGNVLTQATAAGTTTYGHDADNRITSLTYSSPAAGYAAAPNVSYLYDADGSRTQMTDGTGTTLYHYDSLERLQTLTNGAGSLVTYGYDSDGETTCLSYPLPGAATCQSSGPPRGLGVVTKTYDGAGELSSVTDWQGNVNNFSYDSDGNLQTTNLANGLTSSANYYADDTTKSISDAPTGSPNSTIASFGYTRNADGQVSAETDTGVPAPTTQSYSYDQITRLASDSTGPYHYNSAGNLTGLPDGTTMNASASSQELLSLAAPITEVGQLSGASSTLGETSAPLPSGIQAYDQILVAVIELNTQTANTPAGYTAVGTYGASGSGSVQVQLFRKTAAGGETSVALSYTSSSVQGPTVVLTAAFRGVDAAQPLDGSSGGSSTTASVTAPSITATLPGDELALFQGASEATNNGFTTPAMSESVTSAATPVAGELATEKLASTGPSGDKVSTWNGVSTSLAAIMVALRPSVTTYGYDTIGDRTSATTPGRPAQSYGYDQLGRMVSSNTSTSYGYNGDGLRTTKTPNGSGAESYTWDVSGSQPLVLADGTTNYLYGPDGLPLEQIQTPNIHLVGTGTGSGAPAQSPISASFSAAAAANDQIVVSVSEDAGESSSIAGYTAVGTWTSGTGEKLQVFRKTAIGGETSLAVSVSASTGDIHDVTVATATYRGVDPYRPVDTSGGLAGPASSNAVTVPGISASQADEQLVLLQGASTTTTAPGVEGTWNISGMSEEVQVGDTILTSAAGIADLALGTSTPPSSVSTFVQALPTATALNVAGALVILQPVQPEYYLHDQLGSTRLVTSEIGGTLASYTYSPYGEVLSPPPSISNPFGFAGQYTDPETGLLYLQHRYYDPATGQFLSVDPAVAVTQSLYSYAGDDPVNRVDPLGLCTTPTGNANQPFAYTPGQCTPQQVQQIDQAAAAARAAGPASSCSNVFSCVIQDPGSIVASFNANRGTIEHAEEAVLGTAGVIAGSVLTAGLADVLLEAAGAATEEGGFLGALDVTHLAIEAPFILGPGILATGGAGYLGGYGIYELIHGLMGQSYAGSGRCQ